jgi:hypothetical protein
MLKSYLLCPFTDQIRHVKHGGSTVFGSDATPIIGKFKASGVSVEKKGGFDMEHYLTPVLLAVISSNLYAVFSNPFLNACLHALTSTVQLPTT